MTRAQLLNEIYHKIPCFLYPKEYTIKLQYRTRFVCILTKHFILRTPTMAITTCQYWTKYIHHHLRAAAANWGEYHSNSCRTQGMPIIVLLSAANVSIRDLNFAITEPSDATIIRYCDDYRFGCVLGSFFGYQWIWITLSVLRSPAAFRLLAAIRHTFKLYRSEI